MSRDLLYAMLYDIPAVLMAGIFFISQKKDRAFFCQYEMPGQDNR